MAVHFVNITPQEFQEVALFKLIKENYIGSTLGSAKPYLYFADPASWSDAFEKRFINVLYKEGNNPLVDYPLKNKVFCSCFSHTRIVEAQWFVYSRTKKDELKGLIQLTFNNQQLLDELNRFNAENDADIYIGKVAYQETRKIKGRISKNNFLNVPKQFSLNCEESLIRLLLLKRNAFIAENEIRIIIVKKEPDLQSGRKLYYKCQPTDLISRITINDWFTTKGLKAQLESPIGQSINGLPCYGFTPVINIKGKNHPRVVESHIYSHQHPKFVVV